jgi:hypothetical protein
MKAVHLLVFFPCISAYAQDPNWAVQQAVQASQNAMQASQQAMEQMWQASQLAQQQAMQATQLANQQFMLSMQQTSGVGSRDGVTQPPIFSVKPGTVMSGKKVRIKCFTRDVFIYYTTDGSTPTAKSLRYHGALVIKSSTQLKAIAIAPDMAPSTIAVAKYTVLAPASPSAHGPA